LTCNRHFQVIELSLLTARNGGRVLRGAQYKLRKGFDYLDVYCYFNLVSPNEYQYSTAYYAAVAPHYTHSMKLTMDPL